MKIYRQLTKEVLFDLLQKYVYPIKDDFSEIYDKLIKDDPHIFDWNIVKSYYEFNTDKFLSGTVTDAINYLQSLSNEEKQMNLDLDSEYDNIVLYKCVPENEEYFIRRCYTYLNDTHENLIAQRKQKKHYEDKIAALEEQLFNITNKTWSDAKGKNLAYNVVAKNLAETKQKLETFKKYNHI